MKKNYFLLLCFVLLTMGANAQLKVATDGSVTVKTGFLSDVYKSTFKYTGYSASNEFVIKPANPGVEIGSNTGRIDIWYNTYNTLYASSYRTASDRRLKENIQDIDNSLTTKVLKLKPVKYNLIADSINKVGKKNEIYGLIAQDVETIFPNLVDESSKEIKTIDYNQFIPLLIKLMQEQQAELTILKSEISDLEKAIKKEENTSNKSLLIGSDYNATIFLYQNAPNPFSEQTVIRYYIPKQAFSAEIQIYNTQGILVRKAIIATKGEGALTINGGEFSQGIYFYTLLLNGVNIDTKQMIVTN